MCVCVCTCLCMCLRVYLLYVCLAHQLHHHRQLFDAQCLIRMPYIRTPYIYALYTHALYVCLMYTCLIYLHTSYIIIGNFLMLNVVVAVLIDEFTSSIGLIL